MNVLKKIALALVFLPFLHLNAQDKTYDLGIVVKDYRTEKKSKGAVISVLTNDSLIEAKLTNRKGEAKLQLKTGKEYKILVSQDGRVSRFFYVDLRECDLGEISAVSRIELAVFKRTPDVDYSYIENNPLTRFYFEQGIVELFFDKELALKMSAEVEKVINK